MSIILSLIIEIGCLEPSSISDAGLVKSKSLTLLPTSVPRVSLSSTIYLIGVQEFGNPNMKFNKDQKIDLMHIAICRLLEPYGFYEFDYVDKDGWPHYKIINKLPNLKSGEQSILMKESIINYFIEKQLIE